jgi:hypothetical protein
MKIKSIILVGCVFLLSKPLLAQEKDPKYSAAVPSYLLTPDKVETDLLGTSNFSMVCPVNLRFRKAYDFLDLSRGVEAFLNGMPATSTYAMLEDSKEAG